MKTMKTNELTKLQIINALAMHKGVPTFNDGTGNYHIRTAQESKEINAYLSKKVSLSEILTALDVYTYPFNKIAAELSKDNKVIKTMVSEKLDIKDSDWDKLSKKVDKESEEEEQRVLQELNKAVKKSKEENDGSSNVK